VRSCLGGFNIDSLEAQSAFFGLVAVGAVSTGIAVNRGVESAAKVQAQLDTIQHNTETPHLPPAHSHVIFPSPLIPPSPTGWMPFMEGQQASLNVKYYDGGDYAITDAREGALIIPVRKTDMTANIFDLDCHEIVLGNPSGTLPARGSRAYFETLVSKTANSLN
jgi:hypothetical protein